MTTQIKLDDACLAPVEDGGDGTNGLAEDLACLRLSIVNCLFYGRPGSDGWVLIDTGLASSAATIRDRASRRFGGARPAAIILTHGHFDHVGSAAALAEEWDVPIYAHMLERPYLDGTAAYPPADPRVGGGLMTLLSPLYPTGPVDLGARLRPLPQDGSVPAMPEWRWLHTPGHAPGHVSLWRERDGLLAAGDAVIATGQESAYEVMVQQPEMHGPPRYFTPDWAAAHRSVQLLAALGPQLLVTGHGPALAGQGMGRALFRLARDFEDIAVPRGGRYVRDPATAENGSAYRQP
ncbi:MBL fold metallo-hydrolase [Paracoccus thiocyanatus]|uniref:MBL fold metallo-hydrolase n=1 Tax=Paracoccus thiocyanatus TaxID=34006 RepID=A0A3D8P9S8_9RHOB|nr:MBL fold metallo-hydrolase [Paracoccus thiocyanatus]RDW12814.1 MBL fold metallo-hydrolase [Paracoccus thiocyanatus]